MYIYILYFRLATDLSWAGVGGACEAMDSACECEQTKHDFLDARLYIHLYIYVYIYIHIHIFQAGHGLELGGRGRRLQTRRFPISSF